MSFLLPKTPWSTAALAIGLALLVAAPNGAAALVLRYDFDDSSNPTADSGTGTAAPGTLIGGDNFTTNTPSGTGKAYSTGAGNDAYVTTGTTGNPDTANHPIKLNQLTAFTLTLWVNLRATPATNDRLVSDWNTGINQGFDFRINTVVSSAAFQLVLNVDDGSAASMTGANAANAGANQAWTFLAVTYDGSLTANNVHFYTGAAAVAVSQLGDTTTINKGAAANTATDFQVGGTAASSSDRSPSAFFDDVRVYDEVLDSTALNGVRAANVPEPGVSALVTAGAIGCLGRRRRR